MVCDVRGGVWFKDLEPVLERVEEARRRRARGVVFLEASDETLIDRFRETRRPHPLSAAGTVSEGIERERAELADVRERADVVIDTTGLSIWDLRRRVADTLLAPEGRPRMHVQFVSFGYKHGVPRDADLLMDVRFLQNPHYVPELRALHRPRPAGRRLRPRLARHGRVHGPAGGAARLPAAGLRRGGQDQRRRSGSAAPAAATAA